MKVKKKSYWENNVDFEIAGFSFDQYLIFNPGEGCRFCHPQEFVGGVDSDHSPIATFDIHCHGNG